MGLRLILIRHAKSPHPPGVPDHDRPLNERGRAAADALGRWMAREGLCPDAAIVSDARRTRETWERIAAALPEAPAPRLERGLYEVEALEALAVLRRAVGRTVALVGHNPGIGELAAGLLRTPPDHPRFADYPTGATLVARFPVEDWTALAPRSGAAERFTVPRELDPGAPPTLHRPPE